MRTVNNETGGDAVAAGSRGVEPMNRWYVVNTRPHQEARAEANLLRQGYRAWMPAMVRSRRHARRIETVRVPVFPGYLFVELDIERETWSAINGTFGVRRILTNGMSPLALPREFVTALRRSVSSDGALSLVPSDMKPGERVKIMTGPFVGCVAVVLTLSPAGRVELLLNVLGGDVTTTILRRAIAPAA